MKQQLKQLVTWRFAICNSDLPPTTRHVLLTLSLYMNEMGESHFPTTTKLAMDTGLSKHSVITHLAKAEKCGWIKKYVYGCKGKNWRQHGYELTFPRR